MGTKNSKTSQYFSKIKNDKISHTTKLENDQISQYFANIEKDLSKNEEETRDFITNNIKKKKRNKL